MYDKIKTDTRATFLRLYPHGSLEEITGRIIRYMVRSYDSSLIMDMSIYDVLTIADEIDRELAEIALEEIEEGCDEE